MTINYLDFSKTEVKLGYTTNYSNTEIDILKINKTILKRPTS